MSETQPQEQSGLKSTEDTQCNPSTAEESSNAPSEQAKVTVLPTKKKPDFRANGEPLPSMTSSTTSGPGTASTEGTLSPAAADRVFPVRSVVSVDPTSTPAAHARGANDGYFNSVAHARRQSTGHAVDGQAAPTRSSFAPNTERARAISPQESSPSFTRRTSIPSAPTSPVASPSRERAHHTLFTDIVTNREDGASIQSEEAEPRRSSSTRPASIRSSKSTIGDDMGGLVTARFKHVVTEDGHAIITGRGGDTLQRCEDEPIHIPGAVQGFGLLLALEEQQEGKLLVRVVSENAKTIIGYTPRQLFALDSFTDILSEDQADNVLDHVDFIRDEDADVMTNGPEVFTMSIKSPITKKSQRLWCAMHINDTQPNLIICEFELEDDQLHPLVPPNNMTPEPPEDTLDSNPTEEEYIESTHNTSKPLRVLRSARKRKGEAAAMEVFNIMSQVQEQLASAPNLDKFLKILVGVVKELTGFHRVMVYQFDNSWNGRVVTELVDPRATKDLYKGLNFPASDIPKQARDLYKINKVRMLYDRDQETARLVCRSVEDLQNPLDLTHSYLRAMSPIHLKYLANMAVRSSMSISVNAFNELWGLIACHSYGSKGMRVSFPIRKMCRLVGDSASRNIERLSYASRLQARKLINTVPTQNNPSGYIIASSEDLLKLFDADFGLLSIRDETKILGDIEHSQEALAMLEYLRLRCVTNVMTSQDIREDFPDLRYQPGFQVIAGLLLVPLSVGGHDFIVFFRKGQLKEVKWAGNPYEKYVKEGTEGYLEPRKSFRTWSETVVGKCREWTEEEIETAAVLCLVYGKFIEVWRQKEAALQNSQLTRLLLANSAHEVRTPLNAIINYLEIALEGSLDQETRDNLAKSHSASKSLIYVINDLLDLTKTEEGGELVKDDVFDLSATLHEATDMFNGDAKRKGITYDVSEKPGVPSHVIGDQRRVRQAISNVTANAIQNTSQGGVTVEMYLASRSGDRADVEISISDTGVGMGSKKLDALFRELEQVSIAKDTADPLDEPGLTAKALSDPAKKDDGKTLGLGLAVVARIVRNMNGQLRLKSEEGKGSRFIIQFPFDLPDSTSKQLEIESQSEPGSITPHAEMATPPPSAGEVTLVESRSPDRRPSSDRGPPTRKNSADSVGSRRSLRSARSVLSGKSGQSANSIMSGRSEADRLIEAIQEPHRVEGYNSDAKSRSRGGSSVASRPKLEKRHTTNNADLSTDKVAGKPRPTSLEATHDTRLQIGPTMGQINVTDQGTPLRPVRVPEDFETPSTGIAASFRSSVGAGTNSTSSPVDPTPKVMNADAMRVLVAEDDPVNSRIIKKRLEKLGHYVHLTVNGEECADMYCDKSAFFDIVLMDMQVRVV